MTTEDAPHLDTICRWLDAKQNLLVLTHERPDGDAFGCVYGLISLLTKAGKECDGYLEHPPPRRYAPCLPNLASIKTGNERIDFDAYDGFISVDTTDIERLAVPCNTKAEQCEILCNIDHHPDNSGFGQVQWIDARKGAAAQMLSILARYTFALDEDTATSFLSGMVTDTGGFRFSNTSAALLRESAELMDRGARYDDIVDAVFFHENYNRKKLEASLLANARTAHNHCLMYNILTKEVLDAHGVAPEDTEGLIDVFRTINGVQIACLLHPEEDGVRFSFRARSMQTPVNQIAQKLGGGGHPLAAGARAKHLTVKEAEQQLIALTKEILS